MRMHERRNTLLLRSYNVMTTTLLVILLYFFRAQVSNLANNTKTNCQPLTNYLKKPRAFDNKTSDSKTPNFSRSVDSLSDFCYPFVTPLAPLYSGY